MKYLLLDGNNLAHIAYHRARSIVLKNKKEKSKTKEVLLEASDFPDVENLMFHVFFLKLHKHYKKFKDYFFIMCWDNPGSHEWRRAIYADYKVRRDYETDPIWRVLFDGIAKLQEVLKYYPMYQITIEKLEADDILYAYSRTLKDHGEVVILSGDSDLIQAAQEFGVKLYHPIKDKYIKPPTTYNYCLEKAIRGDNTDDIPGIYGYGPVKATKLAESYEKDANSLNKLTLEQKEIVKRNLQLIDINNNPNLSKAVPDLNSIHNSKQIDFNKIKRFYFDHKLKNFLENFENIISLFT